MAEDKDSKTEKATSKKVRETQEKGQFANSRELTSSFVLLAALLSFLMLGQKTVFQIMETWRWMHPPSSCASTAARGKWLTNTEPAAQFFSPRSRRQSHQT